MRKTFFLLFIFAYVAITASAAEISLKGKQFVPAQMTVKNGETITICNRDSFYHSIFSYSKHNRFGEPKGIRLSPGNCTSVTARNPTTATIRFLIFDELHAYEKLTLSVLPDKPGSEPKKDAGAKPCTDAERSLWNSVKGDWNASYGKVTFQGTCENVSGFWKQGAYGDKGDLHTGKISEGRLSGGSLTFNYVQDWNKKSGTDSCWISADVRTIGCGWLERLSR